MFDYTTVVLVLLRCHLVPLWLYHVILIKPSHWAHSNQYKCYSYVISYNRRTYCSTPSSNIEVVLFSKRHTLRIYVMYWVYIIIHFHLIDDQAIYHSSLIGSLYYIICCCAVTTTIPWNTAEARWVYFRADQNNNRSLDYSITYSTCPRNNSGYYGRTDNVITWSSLETKDTFIYRWGTIDSFYFATFPYHRLITTSSTTTTTNPDDNSSLNIITSFFSNQQLPLYWL